MARCNGEIFKNFFHKWGQWRYSNGWNYRICENCNILEKKLA